MTSTVPPADKCPYLKCRRNGAQTTVTEYPAPEGQVYTRITFRCECGWFNLVKVSSD